MDNFPRISISKAAISILPGLQAWAFTAHGIPDGIDPEGLSRIALDSRMDGCEAAAAATHPRISPWRAAFKAMQLRPSDFRASIEQLVRREVSGRLGTADAWLVERYNRYSLGNLIPMGGYDLAKLDGGEIIIRPVEESDCFEPLGGTSSADLPNQGKILAYAQGDRILCWGLNYRDSAISALGRNTTDALFVSEAVDEQGAADAVRGLRAFASELSELGATCSPIRPFLHAPSAQGEPQ